MNWICNFERKDRPKDNCEKCKVNKITAGLERRIDSIDNGWVQMSADKLKQALLGEKLEGKPVNEGTNLPSCMNCKFGEDTLCEYRECRSNNFLHWKPEK